jgi:hypothetical protein
MDRIRKYSLFLSVTGMLFFIFTLAYGQPVKTYTNKQLNYSINYPLSYTVKTLGEIIIFVSSEKDKKFGFPVNINVVTRVTDYVPKNMQDFFDTGKSRITDFYGNAIFLEEGKDKLSGKEAYRLVYTTKQKEANFKIMEVMLIDKKRTYVITYTALLEQFDRYLKQAKSIIYSFKVSQ